MQIVDHSSVMIQQQPLLLVFHLRCIVDIGSDHSRRIRCIWSSLVQSGVGILINNRPYTPSLLQLWKLQGLPNAPAVPNIRDNALSDSQWYLLKCKAKCRVLA